MGQPFPRRFTPWSTAGATAMPRAALDIAASDEYTYPASWRVRAQHRPEQPSWRYDPSAYQRVALELLCVGIPDADSPHPPRRGRHASTTL